MTEPQRTTVEIEYEEINITIAEAQGYTDIRACTDDDDGDLLEWFLAGTARGADCRGPVPNYCTDVNEVAKAVQNLLFLHTVYLEWNSDDSEMWSAEISHKGISSEGETPSLALAKILYVFLKEREKKND